MLYIYSSQYESLVSVKISEIFTMELALLELNQIGVCMCVNYATTVLVNATDITDQPQRIRQPMRDVRFDVNMEISPVRALIRCR